MLVLAARAVLGLATSNFCSPTLSADDQARVDELLDRTDSHYAAVVVAAKRARQLNSYYRALGEGTYEEYTPPMVETQTGNYLTIALEELAQGKIEYRYRV